MVLGRLTTAGGHALEIEKRIFAELRAAILDRGGPVGAPARALAEIDVASAQAAFPEPIERFDNPIARLHSERRGT